MQQSPQALMTPMTRFRLPAISCALAFLLCELISRPFAEMGICDDWSYIHTARILARTGHIVYNGWGAPVLGWQLFLAAAAIKLFGFSFTVARMPALLVGTLTVFLMQRTLVRSGLTEANATIGTLAVSLCPLYMLLSSTFMTDIFGMFAIVICFYGCVRALQSAGDPATIAWVWFAVGANAIAGSSRQIAWLGVLVIVPSALWLLRARRRVLVAGGLAVLAGIAFIAVVMHWFQQQPYILPEHLFVPVKGLGGVLLMIRHLTREILDLPFLVLAIFAAFIPQIRRGGRRFLAISGVAAVGYALLVIRAARHGALDLMLQPLANEWQGPRAYYEWFPRNDLGPVVLTPGVRVVLTVISIAGLLGVIAFLLDRRKQPIVTAPAAIPRLTWTQIGLLAGPFTLATLALLIPRSAEYVYDRYLLALVFVTALCLIRAYQDFVRHSLPFATVLAVVLIAIYSIADTHDMFAFYRARLAVTQQVVAAGMDQNQLDGGFDYNGWVELQQAGHINEKTLLKPANAYTKPDRDNTWTCPTNNTRELDWFLHFEPRIGLAFHPDACRGPAGLAPVHYFRWLGLQTATIYIVKYGPR